MKKKFCRPIAAFFISATILGSGFPQVSKNITSMTLFATSTTVGDILYEQTQIISYEYIFPNSSIRYLSDYEVSSLSSEVLSLARNEIYARHGYVFKSKDLQNYFKTKSWYKENPKFNSNKDLNKYEIANTALIKKYEDLANKNKSKSKFILSNSSTKNIDKKEIQNFSLELLQLARNEIYARHGYVFTTKKYQDYFGQKSWYKKNSNFKGTYEELNKFEKYNVDLIKKYEEEYNKTISNDKKSYIIPNSENRYLEEKDLVNLTFEMLQLARNEIYARHGYIFKTEKYKTYFESKSWYKKNGNYDGSNKGLNDYEIKNIELLKKYEKLFE